MVNEMDSGNASIAGGVSYRLPRRGIKGELILAGVRALGNDKNYKGKVLVMDDEEIIRTILCVMLLAFGYEPHVAANGDEAISIYKKALDSGKPFNTVIIDLNVRDGMGGMETMRSLREIDPDIQAIVSTALTNDPAILHFGEYGFKGALRKPYTISELRQVLQDVISGTGSSAN